MKKNNRTTKQIILASLMALWASPIVAQENVLWYDKPATHWVEALPLGNGRLGAMVYGGVESDTIQLNEDTFWSGSPYNNVNPKALAALPEIRKALDSGDYQKAQMLSSTTSQPTETSPDTA